jgi:hypothetical protein
MDFSKDNDFLDFFSFSEASVDLHGAEQGDLGDLLSAEMMDSSQMTLSQNNLVQPPEGVQESHPNVDQAQLDKALRNLPVCTPCKQRRIKCDIVLPSCRNCTKLHKDCTFWDIALSQEIPRK